MTMKLGGPPDLVQAVRDANRSAGPTVTWAGHWGTGDGVSGLVHAFWFGDSISPAAISAGESSALDFVRRLAAAYKPGTMVVLESEFNKSGTAGSPPWHDYFVKASAILRGAGHRVVYCPGKWADMAQLWSIDGPALAGSIDLIATQCVIFRPREPSDAQYLAEAVDAVAKIRALMHVSGKPGLLADVLFSTYGGGYGGSPPFAGGDGRALESQQATAIGTLSQGLAGSGVEVVCYRALKDDPGFPTTNYGGYAERNAGVVRSDGSKKPAYDTLIGLASLVTPAPPPVDPLQGALDKANADLAAANAAVAALQAKIAAAQRALQ